MSPELIAIIATAIALLGLILNLQRTLHNNIVSLRERMSRLEANLRERMARLEGLFEGFTGRGHTPDSPS